MEDRYRYKRWALFGISIVSFASFVDVTIVNTAGPFIQTGLQTSILKFQWVPNIFRIILSMTMIAIGKMADLWGRKKIFYFGTLIFALGALCSGFSSSIDALFFFRALQAFGTSVLFTIPFALLTEVMPEDERLHAISIYGGINGVGLLTGPFLAGLVIEFLSWRWVFWVTLPIVAIGWSICLFSLKDHTLRNRSAKIDWLGLALLIIGLGTLTYGIAKGAQAQWHSTIAWLFLTIGILALIGLVIVDEIRKEPLLDLHIFKEKLISLATLSAALAGIVSSVFMFFDPFYLRTLRHLSPLHVGFLIAIIPAAQVLVAFSFKWIVKKSGVASLILIAILSAFVGITLHRVIHSETTLPFLILPFFLLGINWGLTNASMKGAISQVIPSNKIGSAMGTILTLWNITGSILLATSTALFHNVERLSSFLPAFHSAVTLNIICAALITTTALFLYAKLPHKKQL